MAVVKSLTFFELTMNAALLQGCYLFESIFNFLKNFFVFSVGRVIESSSGNAMSYCVDNDNARVLAYYNFYASRIDKADF